MKGVKSCSHTFVCSACFKRQLTMAAWTPKWSTISANRHLFPSEDSLASSIFLHLISKGRPD